MIPLGLQKSLVAAGGRAGLQPLQLHNVGGGAQIVGKLLAELDTLFNKRDYARAETFWSPRYIQHSAHIEPGREGLFNLIKSIIKSIPATLKYEPGLIVAEGNFVIMHGRFSGMGFPVNWIAADILRIENGILVEHWDVIQEEATEEQSKSKAPMFGSSFPVYSKLKRTNG